MVPEAEEWYRQLYPCEPKECRFRELSVKINWASRLALAAEGTLIVDTQSSHFIQEDSPDLVIFAIRKVLSSVSRSR